MIGPGRLVVVGEGLRSGTTIEDAVDAVMRILADLPAGSDYAVGVLDREHGGRALAVGIPPAGSEGDASVIAGLGAAMARHFTRVSAPSETSIGTSMDLPGADD